jgi:hypothetical protein
MNIKFASCNDVDERRVENGNNKSNEKNVKISLREEKVQAMWMLRVCTFFFVVDQQEKAFPTLSRIFF